MSRGNGRLTSCERRIAERSAVESEAEMARLASLSGLGVRSRSTSTAAARITPTNAVGLENSFTLENYNLIRAVAHHAGRAILHNTYYGRKGGQRAGPLRPISAARASHSASFLSAFL